MSICLSSPSATRGSDLRYVRVLKWTFRREDETVVCELGLTRDESAYELRINPPWNPSALTAEIFGDAMAAFERHGVIERILVQEGWSLDGFQSDLLRRH